MTKPILFCCALLSPFALLVLVTVSGLRINRSHSFPVGFYWALSHPPALNDLVFFLPPHRRIFDLAKGRGYIGASPGGYELILKRIVAEAGDVVSIDVEGVTVNGRLLGNSAPQATDPAGRPLPVYRLYNYQLQDGEVLTMSDYSGRSFDSRYYGPIPCACIQSVVRPIFTW
ncbi:MAG: hypothetical protein QOH35_4989 [Acidobacteriaceae bacterium]|nr:hypothetical protein [Acidobacteriaceae bacterium]